MGYNGIALAYLFEETTLVSREVRDGLSHVNFEGRWRRREAFLPTLGARLPIPAERTLPV